jgi:SAM-dependent methyltransferase
MPIERSREPDSFTALEHEGWSRVIEDYQDLLGRLTQQAVEATLDAASVKAGDRLLDVCTGHAILATAAASRGAIVRGLDFSEAVLAVARRNAPVLVFDQGNAQELPYAAASFDVVVCGFGIIHVPDPARGLAEIYRVLKPGGRTALSAWARAAPTNGFGLLFGSVRTHGRTDVPLPHGPDMFQFGDEASMRAALADSGFDDVKAMTFPQIWTFERPDGFFDAIMRSGVRGAALLKAQEELAFAAIASAVEEGVKSFAADGRFEVPMPAVIGSAKRP